DEARFVNGHDLIGTIESNRFVTGVTWVAGELWHGTREGDESDLRRVDPQRERSSRGSRCRPEWAFRPESDGGDPFFCGGGGSGKVRTVRRRKRGSAAGGGPHIPAD